MRWASSLLLALVLAACATTQAAAPTPQAALQPVYDAVVRPNGAGRPSLDLLPLSDSLRALIARMDSVSNARNEPILDFDPVTDSQDGRVSDVVLDLERAPSQGHARVAAHFKIEGEPRLVRYDMIETPRGWRVENIVGDDWNLRALAQAGIDAPAP